MTYSQMPDIPLTDFDVPRIEKGNPPALAFRNDDIASLSWHDLSVEIADRATGKNKFILSKVSGLVQAGKTVCRFIPYCRSLTQH